jgi:hypothetical protein
MRAIRANDVDVADLPTTLNTEQAAELLGVSRGALWASSRDGDAPVAPIKVGRALRWPTLPILRALGLVVETDGDGEVDADGEVEGQVVGG